MGKVNKRVFHLTLVAVVLSLSPAVASARMAYVTGVNREEVIATKVTSAPLAGPEPGTYVAQVDLGSETFGPEIPLGGRGAAWAVAITPDGSRAYAVDTSEGRVVPVDIATNTAEPPIAVGHVPLAIAITPDGSRALVANVMSDTVTPIDLTSDTAEPPISVGSEPTDVAITPDGSRAYVTDGGANTVTPIDLGTNTVEAAITVGNAPFSIAITPDGSRAYVADSADQAVTPIDLGTNTAEAAIAIGHPAGSIAITPDGTRAFVIGFDGVVRELDLTTNSASTEFPFGGDFLYGLAVTSDGSRALVTDNSTEELRSIDVPGGALGGSFGIGEGPEGIAVVPNQGPTAAFTASAEAVATGEAVEFDAGASSDSDGSVARYDWDFGDGETESTAGPAAGHTYKAAGTYTVTLTVADNEGCAATLVFTGQTAYCNGSAKAQATRTVTVSDPEPPEEPVVAEAPREPVAATVDPLPEPPPPEVKTQTKKRHRRRCPIITAARAATFTPKIVLGHTVPGVRVRVSSNHSVRLRASGTLLWSRNEVLHRAALGKRARRVNGWIRLRFSLPPGIRSELSFKQMVMVQLRLEALPGGGAPKACRRVFSRTVPARIVNVFPDAVQRGKLPYHAPRARG